MSRVAIIGSCVTRDLWPIRGDGVEGLLYVSRTSLPSLFSPAAPGFRASDAPPPGLTRHQHRAVVTDLTKRGLAEVVAHRPTHLIFDFIDERFDLLRAGPALVTHSWELDVSGYLKRPRLRSAQAVARLSQACDELWARALLELAALVRSTTLREAKLILHEAQWAEASRGEDGRLAPLEGVEILAGRPEEIGAHNALLHRYQQAFREAFPEAEVVQAAPYRLADPGHRWGLSPFHYVPEYYAAIWSQLERLGV